MTNNSKLSCVMIINGKHFTENVHNNTVQDVHDRLIAKGFCISLAVENDRWLFYKIPDQPDSSFYTQICFVNNSILLSKTFFDFGAHIGHFER